MSKTMNRDEARVWLAQNPGREVYLLNTPGGAPDYYHITADGVLQHHYGDRPWTVSTGLIGGTYRIVEPEKPKEDELGKALDDFNFQPHAFGGKWLAPILRAEIARIADERISKAKVRHGFAKDGRTAENLIITFIPGDE